MPTSSQALNWLKQLTEPNPSSPYSSDVSSSIPLPHVFHHRQENRTDADSSQHLPSEVPTINSQQSSPRQLCESEALSKCVPLPPIVNSSAQLASSILLNSKESAAVTRESKQLLVIDLKALSPTFTEYDNETQSSQDIGKKLDSQLNHVTCRRDDKIDEVDTHPEKMPNGFTNSRKDQPEKQQDQNEDTENMIFQLGDNKCENNTTTQSTNPPYYNISKNEDMCIPSYYADYFPATGYSFSQPKATNKRDFKAEEGTFQEYDFKTKKPLLACVLNLNICGQSSPIHEDKSSCVGILSYNHQMRRHVWSLVPQNLRTPQSNIRGRFIKSRKSGDSLSGTSFYDQIQKMCTSCQRHQRVKAINEISDELEGLQVLNNDLYEESGTDVTLEGYSSKSKADFNQAKDGNNLSGNLCEISSIAQLNAVMNNWNKEERNAENNLDEVTQFPQRRLYDNLRCSGLINNESYFFRESDNIDVEPHFLETLISVPKPEGFIEEFIPNQPCASNLQNNFQLYQINFPPPVKENTIKPEFRTFTGLTLTQKQKAKSIAQMKNPLPKVCDQFPKDWSLKIPPVATFNSLEMKGNSTEAEQPHTNDKDILSKPTSYNSLSTHAESQFIGMRTELPPSRPNRLCFRTSLSGCFHAEVLSQIESQRNVKVTWLQYEPTSLHCSDITNADYRQVCMWLFELSQDSDTASLLLEGFKLRGHRMNILRLDDVYREEYRTFNLCNEIYLEQRSKNLIKNKPRHFVKSARLFNVN